MSKISISALYELEPHVAEALTKTLQEYGYKLERTEVNADARVIELHVEHVAPERQAFVDHCHRFGLDATRLGQSFTYRRDNYRMRGYVPDKHRFLVVRESDATAAVISEQYAVDFVWHPF